MDISKYLEERHKDEDIDNIRSHLSKHMIELMEGIQIVVNDRVSFLPELYGVCDPGRMLFDGGNQARQPTIYAASEAHRRTCGCTGLQALHMDVAQHFHLVLDGHCDTCLCDVQLASHFDQVR